MAEVVGVHKVRLKNCPPGLFWYKDALCFRSEYSTVTTKNPWQPDAYVVASGEYFWGGTSDSLARSELFVTPVDLATIPKVSP